MCIYAAGMCAYLSSEGDVLNYCVLMDCQGQCSVGDFPPCRACNIGVCPRSSAPCDNNEHRRWRTAHGGCGWHPTCPFRRTSGPGSFLGATTRGVAFGAQPVLLSDGAFGFQPVFLNGRVFNAGANAAGSCTARVFRALHHLRVPQSRRLVPGVSDVCWVRPRVLCGDVYALRSRAL